MNRARSTDADRPRTDRTRWLRIGVAILTGAMVLLAPATRAAGDSTFLVGAPLPVRNEQPVARVLGVPRARGTALAGPGEWIVGLDVAVANSFSEGRRRADAVILDGETAVTTLELRRGVASGVELSIEVPWVVHSGGSLDPVIETFHDVFGFGSLGRDRVAAGRIDYRVIADGTTAVRVDDVRRGIGDVRLGLGARVFGDPGSARALVVRAQVELPTGRVHDLTGNGAWELALGGEYRDSELLRTVRGTVFVRAGVVHAFEGDLLPDRQRHWLAYGGMGLAFRPFDGAWLRGLRLHGQLDAYTAGFDRAVDELGGASLTGALGIDWRLGEATGLSLLLVEDLVTGSAADAVLQAGIRSRI